MMKIKSKGFKIAITGCCIGVLGVFLHQQDNYDVGYILAIIGWIIVTVGFFIHARYVFKKLKDD